MSIHTISCFVENHHGALSRVSGLFSSRGYNIQSLNVAETDDPTLSRMTIVVNGDKDIIEQIVKHLNRLIDVVKVVDFTNERMVERELVLIKLNVTNTTRHEILSFVEIYHGKVAAVLINSLTIELSGTTDMINDFIHLVRPYGIKEIVRSGRIAIFKQK